MADKFAKANIRNVGSFKSPVVEQRSTVIDKATIEKVEDELNSICDTLYVPLSYGVKIPASTETSVYYDASTDAWAIDLLRSDSYTLVSDVSSVYDGSVFVGLDLIFDTTTQALTTELPLVFVTNTSEISGQARTITFLPRPMLGAWGTDATCRVHLVDSSGGVPDFSEAAGITGLKATVLTFLHSSVDGYDVPSVEYTDPMIEYSTQTVYPGYVVITHNVHSNGGTVERSCKTRFKAAKYSDDGTFLGELKYSDWPVSFITGERDSTISGLRASSLYYVYYIVDCEQGHDLLEWVPLTMIRTLSRGEDGPYVIST